MRYQSSLCKVLLSLLFVLVGCGGNPTFQTPSVMNTVDMNAQDWDLLYGSGTPDHPTALKQGWQFAIPQDGSVHYVEVPYRATENLTGKTLTATFQAVSSDAEYRADVETNETEPAQIHLFFEREDDDFTNNEYRWWCRAGVYILGTNDNQTLTLSCPLTSDSWTDVVGGHDGFSDALSQIGAVGITFGGTIGWGHGVRLTSGTAQFQLIDYSIKSVPAP